MAITAVKLNVLLFCANDRKFSALARLTRSETGVSVALTFKSASAALAQAQAQAQKQPAEVARNLRLLRVSITPPATNNLICQTFVRQSQTLTVSYYAVTLVIGMKVRALRD